MSNDDEFGIADDDDDDDDGGDDDDVAAAAVVACKGDDENLRDNFKSQATPRTLSSMKRCLAR